MFILSFLLGGGDDEDGSEAGRQPFVVAGSLVPVSPVLVLPL